MLDLYANLPSYLVNDNSLMPSNYAFIVSLFKIPPAPSSAKLVAQSKEVLFIKRRQEVGFETDYPGNHVSIKFVLTGTACGT